MFIKLAAIVLCSLAVCSMAAAEARPWWNPRWRFRTRVTRPTPYRTGAARPIEAALDLPLLLQRAGIDGELDPASVRVVERDAKGIMREVPFESRGEPGGRPGREQAYLAWMARPRPRPGRLGTFDVYFDTKDRAIPAPKYASNLVPPANVLKNPGFDDGADGGPAHWQVEPAALASLGRFAHTTGPRSLKIVIDEATPRHVSRAVTISQRIDVRKFAGQEMLFECGLLAERAPYGAPVSIELRQFRSDGTPILECAIEPRWLTLELAQGQLVRFSERGRFSREAAIVDVCIRVRCIVRDADTWQVVTGPEACFTVWIDRVAIRPGERWPWPGASGAGFVEGAIEEAPVNRGFEFTGQRRLAFNGASEGTLTAGRYNPDPKSVHWGVEAGTLEFWCRPSWDAEDGVERIFFTGFGYLYRLQSQLRKRDREGKNLLELRIADGDRKLHTIGGPARLQAGRWHHIAATWSFPQAQLQLFLDGKRVAAHGPGAEPWPSSRRPKGGSKVKGIGLAAADKRSVPMQAFIGGRVVEKKWPEADAVEAVLDEFRISDVCATQRDSTRRGRS